MHATPQKSEPETVDATASAGESVDSVADVRASKLPLEFLAPAQAPDELGRLGHYRVLKVLGKGGMGAVFLAEDIKLKRHVALKVMLPKFAEDETAKERFLREAQTAAAIEHDHIVHIYQVDEDRGVPFLAMQLLSGSSLEDVLRRAGRLTVPQILRLGAQIAEGLAVAHAKGLIHRDIKPANIWIEANYGGRVKILDFGLARAAATDGHITQSGVILGTPAYMPPEQARGDTVDHRCDLYALGCVMYRMATGELPHKGKDTMALLMALAIHEPTPPRAINADIPEALSELILKLLAKETDKRPDSAKTVAHVLKKMEQEAARTSQPGDVTGELAALAQPVSQTPVATTATEASNPFANLSGSSEPAGTRATSAVPVTAGSSAGTHVGAGKTTQVESNGKNRIFAGAAVFLALATLAVVATIIWKQRGEPGQGRSPNQVLETAPYTTPSKHALVFDGKSSHVLVPTWKYNGAHPLTIEMDIKSAKAQAADILSDGVLEFGWRKPQLELGVGTEDFGWFGVHVNGAELPQQAQHVAIVLSRDELRVYLNGKLAGKSPLGGRIRPSEEVLTFGTHAWTARTKPKEKDQTKAFLNYFEGQIQRIRISKVARYAEDFVPPGRYEPDKETMVLYHFDEGQGEKLTDSSGNNHHGKIVGAKWVKVDAVSKQNARVPKERFALRFGPTDVGVHCGGKLSRQLEVADAYTIEAIVTPEGEPDPRLTHHQLVATTSQTGLLYSPEGRTWALQARFSKDPKGFVVVGRYPYSANQTIHLAGVWDRGRMALYVDGKLNDFKEVPRDKLAAGEPHCGIGGGGFTGVVRGIRISKVARYNADFTPDDNWLADKETLALYRCDEGQGNALTDLSGNNHHGKINGAKWVKVDEQGSVGARTNYQLDFDGVGAYVEAPSLDLPAVQPVTWEAYVTPRGTSNGQQRVVGQVGTATGLSRQDTKAPSSWVARHVDVMSKSPDGSVELGRRVHLAGVWDGKQCRLYVDGKEQQTRFDNLSFKREGKAGITIGGQIDHAGKLVFFFNGQIDEVRISKNVRYVSDFAPQPRFESDNHTLALYHCDEGQGETLTDSSGNNHHGKIVGAKWVRVEGPGTAPAAGSSLQFESKATFVEIPSLRLDAADPVTLEGYFTLDNDKAGMLVARVAGKSWMALSMDKGNWGLMAVASDTIWTAQAPNTVRAGVKTHVAGAWDGRDLHLLVDGKAFLGTPSPRSDPKQLLGGQTGVTQIGGSLQPLVGKVHGLRVSKVARYAKDSTPPKQFDADADTLALYRFDEGEGEKLIDRSGKGHDGKIVGAKWIPLKTTP